MFNLIFVCDKCLKEFKISRWDFNPFGPTEEMKESGWKFPNSFVKYVSEGHGEREIPSSSVVCLCPNCQ